MMRIAVCQYKIEELNWNLYVEKINSLILNAKQNNVQLIVFPEYAGIEIAGEHDNDTDLFSAIQPLLPKYLNLFQELANQHHIFIQPGSIPFENEKGKYVNRAYFFGPDMAYGFQDKLQLTEFEKNSGLFLHAKDQTVFDTPIGKIGIAICYDSEFPEIVRSLVKDGAQLILVPSYSSTLASYYRVALSCRARAIENQCYVATSFVVGSVSAGTEIPEEAHGRAGIFGPADNGFPDNGIITRGTMNREEIIFGDIDLEKLSVVRQNGQVRNFEDAKLFQITK